MTLPSRDQMAAIAATRFGMGARPGEIAAASADPQAYLVAQIQPQGADQPAASSDDDVAGRLQDVREAGLAKAQKKAATPTAATAAAPDAVQAKGGKDRKAAAAKALALTGNPAVNVARQDVGGDFLSRAQLGATTPAGFRERWALFWTNHFTVSGTKLVTASLVGPFENQAVRPHVFGKFGDMLVASTQHPAMLSYLDQVNSIGPDSASARRTAGGADKKPAGLNENLAREVMELHTVGVDAGYSQSDVTEFARALTGWSYQQLTNQQRQAVLRPALARAGRGGARLEQAVAMAPSGDVGDFIFHAQSHEPGTRTVMGRKYSEGGEDQGMAVLHDLAANPNTAKHLATKIARHFVADDPPQALVDRLAKTYTDTGGDLSAVAKTLIASDEAWQPQAQKFKTPYEFLISSYRAVGAGTQGLAGITPTLTGMGQKPFNAPSPKGWDDIAATWAAPDAVVKRMVWAQTYAAKARVTDPNAFAQQALGARLTPAVATAVSRAETRPEAVALLLMSPEFQRR